MRQSRPITARAGPDGNASKTEADNPRISSSLGRSRCSGKKPRRPQRHAGTTRFNYPQLWYFAPDGIFMEMKRRPLDLLSEVEGFELAAPVEPETACESSEAAA